MYRLMPEERANYHVTTMSRALEIDRKGFYKWLKRTGGEDPWERPASAASAPARSTPSSSPTTATASRA